MKILITGSSGHLGEALVRTLRQTSHEILGIDLLPSEFTDRVGSITDRSFVRDCMNGVEVVLHTATLHKPHISTHSRQDFIDTNVTGTLILLEEALRHKVDGFIHTSTTSGFGDALSPLPGDAAIWVTEELLPVPKNIYGVTKRASEDLCQLFTRNHQLPCIILTTSRFFPEEDDRQEIRETYDTLNVKANELTHRRVDLEDVVQAHLLAMQRFREIGFGKYIISATTPFRPEDLKGLAEDAPAVVREKYPDFASIYAAKDWKMFPHIGRVYVNEKARSELGWQPKYDFQHVLDCLKEGRDFRSPLARQIGQKGYHEETT